MTISPVISAKKLCKYYDIYEQPRDRLLQSFQRLWLGKKQYARKFRALNNISFEVNRGECLGILGRNGAGKSTLLQLIAGTLEPTTGEVVVNGIVAALLELGSGFNPDFTGRENIYLNASILGLNDEEINRKYDDIAAFADIGDFIEQPVKTYSSGMMMRLAFAVQTAVEPDILIIDEALAVGDARFQKKCFDRMYRLKELGGTILFVTHDSGTIIEICDKALILENGFLYDQGDPHTIARKYHRLLFGASESNFYGEQELECRSTTNQGIPSLSNPSIDNEPDGNITQLSSREIRYGSKQAEITHVGIRDNHINDNLLLETHKEYIFYFNAKYNNDINNPVAFGFTISNSKGLEIYGTKGGLHNKYLNPGRKGDTFVCSMRVHLLLVPGVYFLSVALAPPEEYASESELFYDYRFDVLQFQVIGKVTSFATSLIDLNSTLFYKSKSDYL